jgi:phosphate transport system permease protein
MSIYSYAISPYDDWHRQAWAGALVLLALVFIISLTARFVTRAKYGLGGD